MNASKSIPFFLLLLSGCGCFFDFTPPEITIVSPEDGETIYGPVVLRVRVEDKCLAEVEIYGNGDTLGRYVKNEIVDTFSLAEGVWTIEIKAWDRGGNHTVEEINLKVEKLPAPLLISPANGDTFESIFNNVNVKFCWRGVEGAVGYEIQIDNTPDFSTPMVDTFIYSNSFIFQFPSKYRIYSWRVRGKDITGRWGKWSSVWGFVTITIPSGYSTGTMKIRGDAYEN